jgi:hypothetical protein
LLQMSRLLPCSSAICASRAVFLYHMPCRCRTPLLCSQERVLGMLTLSQLLVVQTTHAFCLCDRVTARMKRFTLTEREVRDLSDTSDNFKVTDRVCGFEFELFFCKR